MSMPMSTRTELRPPQPRNFLLGLVALALLLALSACGGGHKTGGTTGTASIANGTYGSASAENSFLAALGCTNVEEQSGTIYERQVVCDAVGAASDQVTFFNSPAQEELDLQRIGQDMATDGRYIYGKGWFLRSTSQTRKETALNFGGQLP